MKATNQLHLHNALNLVDVFQAGKPLVSTTITSPPYWNQKDYGTDEQIGFGQSKEDYLRDLEIVFRNCHTVTKETGSLWVIVDDYREQGVLQLLPFQVADCAKRAGWHLRDLIVWDKHHDLPYRSKGHMRQVTEFILFMTKTATSKFKYETDRVKNLEGLSKWWVDFPERFNPKGKLPTNVWSIPVRTKGDWRRSSKNKHQCPFPTELVSRMIEIASDPGDLVMDCFAGSGMVLAVAEAMKRDFVGFEVNPEYITMYKQTVRCEVAAEWTEIEKFRAWQEGSSFDFEQAIMRLRALKYARQVMRPFLAALDESAQTSVRAVICEANVPNVYVPKKPFTVEVSLVVDDASTDYHKALASAKERSKNPPLTRFGIKSTIRVLQRNELKLGFNGQLDQTYYLYPHYKPRAYVAEEPLRRWFEDELLEKYIEDGKVPLLSNVDADFAWALKT